jgi:hypothetical protein
MHIVSRHLGKQVSGTLKVQSLPLPGNMAARIAGKRRIGLWDF